MKSCPTCFEVKRDGRVVRVICMGEKRPSFKKLVTSEVCGNCPVPGMPPETPQKAHTEPPEITPLGTLIYARTGWEAPPVPFGYRRKTSDLSSDDAWVLEPLYPVCKHLELVPAEMGSCGYQRVAKRCTLVQSFVGQRTCECCEKREE